MIAVFCYVEPMRKENLYTVSLLYIRGFAESITALFFDHILQLFPCFFVYKYKTNM